MAIDPSGWQVLLVSLIPPHLQARRCSIISYYFLVSLQKWITSLRIHECLQHNNSEVVMGCVSITFCFFLTVRQLPFVSSQWLLWRKVTNGKSGSSFLYKYTKRVSVFCHVGSVTIVFFLTLISLGEAMFLAMIWLFFLLLVLASLMWILLALSTFLMSILLELLIPLFDWCSHHTKSRVQGTSTWLTLENSCWFIVLCMCGSSIQRGYQDIQTHESSTGQAFERRFHGQLFSHWQSVHCAMFKEVLHMPNPLVLSPFYSDRILLYFDSDPQNPYCYHCNGLGFLFQC